MASAQLATLTCQHLRQMGMKRIRVFLARMPPLLHDIIKDALSSQADMELVGDLGAGQSAIDALEDGPIDVMIVGAREPDDSAPTTELFLSSPHSRVLVIAISGRSAVMHQLRPHKRPLRDVSRQSLLDAIRDDP